MNIEEKWWNKFCKILDEMPETIEILIGAYGEISTAKRGASSQYFNKNGDVDNVPTLSFDSWNGKGVENNGSSL